MKYVIFVLGLAASCFAQRPAIGGGGGGGGGSSSGSVAVQANGVAVGSQPILNFIPAPDITNTLSDTGTKINIQQGVDTAVIPTIASIQAGPALNCNPASASGTTYTCGLPTALTTYTTGQMLILKPDTNGTGGATTLNIDALGARPIKEWDGTTNPTSSDLVSGRPYFIWNDGTNWRLPYVPSGSSSSTPGTSGQFLTTDGSGGYGTSVSGIGTGNVVRAISPPLTGTPTAPTPAATDNSTTLATTAYVTTGIANAINAAAGRDLVTAASAAVLPNTPTYSNGVSGIGATLTSGSNVALVVDGYTCVINDRILVKNQASALQNGIYYCSQVGTGILPWILTRAIDYDTPSDINNTIVPVANHGTVNALTSWIQTATVATVGTDSITFAAFTPSGANIVTSVSPGAGIARFAGGTQAATSSEISGDCTSSGSNALTCTKTSGVSFGTAATKDITRNGFYLQIGTTNYIGKSFYAATTPPSYTNLNVSGSAVKTVNADGSVTLAVPGVTTGYTGMSGGTFTTSAVIAFNTAGSDDSAGLRFALVMRESATGKTLQYGFDFFYNAYSAIGNNACWTGNGSTYSGVSFGNSRPLNYDPGMIWVKVVKNGSNYNFSWSGDGTNFILMTGDTTALTTCFTTGADQVGISIYNKTANAVSATVYSQVSN